MIVAIVTYISTTVFLGLFDETALAMMTCTCLDIDLHGEAKFGPPTFHDAFTASSDEKNKVSDAEAN